MLRAKSEKVGAMKTLILKRWYWLYPRRLVDLNPFQWVIILSMRRAK